VSSTEVSLHIAGSLDPILVNTGMQMRGLAVGNSCFVCYRYCSEVLSDLALLLLSDLQLSLLWPML